MKIFWQTAHIVMRSVMTVVLLFVLCVFPWWSAGAYEDRECLVCHKEYGGSPEAVPENVSRLYIDQEAWNRDVHFEVVGLVCDDCHADATPETHPEEGLQKVNCAECHDEVAAQYYQTAHWTAPSGEGDRKPDCADCHTPHAIRAKDDPEASTFKGNIQQQCLACHQEREPSTRLLNKLLVFRVSAHRKSDISERFDPAECVNCHYTQAVGHGDNPLTENYCGTCHSTEAQVSGVVFGPFHLDPSLKNQPLVFAVELLNVLIFLALLGVLVLVIARGFVKGRGDKSAQQPEG